MAKQEKPTRGKQIEVMVGAKKRQDEFARRWLAKPEFKATLRRRGDDTPATRKKVIGRV